MARYIDADLLVEKLEQHFDVMRDEDGRLLYSDHICTGEDCDDLLKLVNAMPTADVVEVKQEEKLKQIIATERKKLKAYKQIVKGHSAYISILLKKLGATKDNVITITAEEVAEALKKYETRGIPIDGGFSLYYEDVEDDGVQAEITTVENEKGN